METKPLLFGLIGFFIGGLIVSLAVMYQGSANSEPEMGEMNMSQMTESLKDLKGDAYDKAFITHMIDHHEGAVEMAKLSAENAKHDEIKTLSENIIIAQEKEIAEMKQWQADWGYASMMMDGQSMNHDSMGH